MPVDVEALASRIATAASVLDGAVQPEQRDVVFRGANAAGRIGRFRGRDEASVGEQRRGRSAVDGLCRRSGLGSMGDWPCLAVMTIRVES